MKIHIDGKEAVSGEQNFLSLRDVFEYHKAQLVGRGLMIYKIEADNGEINPADMAKYAVKELKEVRFSTKTKEQLLKDALKEIVANLPNLARDLTQIITSLRKGDDKKGLEDYLSILPLLNTIIMGLRSVEVGSGENFGIDYPVLIECLKNINQAYENKDYILLADSLEYAFLPWVKKMSDAIMPRLK